MSQFSSTSTTSTVPDELIDNHDEEFIEELNIVDILYFGNQLHNHDNVSNEDSDTESETEDVNYDSDSDSDCNLDVDSVPIELSEADQKEYVAQAQFKSNTCNCKGLKHLYAQPCSEVVDFNKLVELRESCKELTRELHDGYFVSQDASR